MLVSDEPAVVLYSIAIRRGPDWRRRYNDSLKAGPYGVRTPVSLRDLSVLHIRHDRSWVPPSLLYSGYLGSFPGLKRRERGCNH
jgi:hypothetical protein